MPNQVDGAFVRAMSGTELSRVRTEFRPRPPRTYQLKPLESRAAEIVMQSSATEGSEYATGLIQQEAQSVARHIEGHMASPPAGELDIP